MTTITPPPASPDRGHGQAAYNAEVAAYLAWQAVNASEMAAFANSVDPLVTLTPSIISAMNFKGAWSSLSGALSMPASVVHNNVLWMLVQNLANVTTVAPGTNTAYWVSLTGWSQVGATYTVSSSPTEIAYTNIALGGSAIGFEFDGITHGSGTPTLDIAVSSNNGANWSAWLSGLTTSTVAASTPVNGQLIVEGYGRGLFQMVTGLVASTLADPTVTSRGGSGVLVGVGRSVINAVKFRWSTATPFTAGSVKLIRRP